MPDKTDEGPGGPKPAFLHAREGEDFLDPVQEPSTLSANVIDASTQSPRIHGYDVDGDLLKHYGLADMLWLSLRGELPTEVQARVFERALLFSAPISIAEAPTHAALLSRIVGADNGACLASGALTLAAQSARLVAEHRSLWSPELAAVACEHTFAPSDVGARGSLAQALGDQGSRLPDELSLCRVGAALALLASLGFESSEALESLLCTVRLVPLMSEVLSHRAGAIATYPLNLPRFEHLIDER